jgi:hypothetical protein
MINIPILPAFLCPEPVKTTLRGIVPECLALDYPQKRYIRCEGLSGIHPPINPYSKGFVFVVGAYATPEMIEAYLSGNFILPLVSVALERLRNPKVFEIKPDGKIRVQFELSAQWGDSNYE